MKASELRTSELRIGNLIYDENREIVVDVAINILTAISHKIEHYKPIPLTEEWLLKFGFEKEHNTTDFDYWFKKGFCDDILWQHSEGFCHNLNYGGEIKYAHQLQNLYFALMGEELTLEP